MSVRNFSWVIPGKFAGCGRPDFSWKGTAEWLAEQGVGVLVSFTMPAGSAKEECKKVGVEWLYHPIEDFDIPDNLNAFDALIKKTLRAVEAGKGVCMHCAVGIGRTGMGLSCAIGKYLLLSADKAIAAVRAARPGSVEMPGQEAFVKLYLDNY